MEGEFPNLQLNYRVGISDEDILLELNYRIGISDENVPLELNHRIELQG